ncbi:hypothetical protein CFRA_03780 [Corynebacterium frankenforstense DSM 45800]|uniref:DUF1648 domain-containing protein n=1 Tax=Corynebacterium frankenforstense DSM 45800 TaxID=1437875 RepID=A0A1L7CRT0_9CORY|nr:DUF5808 domain-containing protein [Corynebacterium frankenforstense]APT88542.1 hypothetical protein CFRA_03780 [Corynebacterium frankenforstense DSM 45800]
MTRAAAGWLAATALVLVATVAFAASYYAAVPDPMPVHWGAGGPDGFQRKTPAGFLGLHALAPGILLVVQAGGAALIRVQARAAGSLDERAHRLYQRALGSFMTGVSLVCALFVHGLSRTAAGDDAALWRVLSSGWFFAAGLVVLLAWLALGFRGTGVVYFDRGDERVLVEHRGGTGVTLNFARPGAWGILAALLAPAALVTLLAVFAG